MKLQMEHEVLEIVRDQLAQAREAIVAAKQKLAEAEQIGEFWNDFFRFASNGWYLHLLDLLSKNNLLIQKINTDQNNVNSIISTAQFLASKEVEDLLRRYPVYLEETCNSMNLKLDSNSRHPQYTLDNGFLRLQIDESKRLAKISDHEGKLAEFPADVKAVVEKLQKEHKRLFGRPFDGKKFLKRLRNEYLAIIKKDKKEDGTSIPIRHLTRRLGKNVKGFRSDEFLIDLSRLAKEGPFEIDKRQIDLQQTKDTSQGMLLHGAAGRGYIGFIVFKEVNHESTSHTDSGN